jgi:hypothetical protein
MQYFVIIFLTFIVLQSAAAEEQVIQDCPTCPKVVVVAPGSFIMGDDEGYKYSGP